MPNAPRTLTITPRPLPPRGTPHGRAYAPTSLVRCQRCDLPYGTLVRHQDRYYHPRCRPV